MLLDLRETVRNSKPIKYTLITLICIPFALVGIGSYFSGGSAASVAEVNGQAIDQQQLERAYQQQRQQLAQMFGGQLPPAFANESVLREQALQQLITQQVLEGEVVKQRFAVGDETLGRAIRELPNFQVDGKFDSNAYQNQLRSSGLSVPAFEQSYRDDTALNQFRQGVSGTSFTLKEESNQLASLARQTRTVEGVRFDFEAVKAGIEASEEEITSHFADNADSYQFPERAKIEYIELSSADLAAAVDISDEQARTYYDENRGSYIREEQREASHILLSAEEGDEEDQIAKLLEAKARIEAGELFADLAKELSDDVGSADLGGSLGTISPGAMVAEFEEAVFALAAADDISEPVVSDFGVHLIKLDAIVPESGKPYEEVQEDIVATMKQNEADSSYFDLREALLEYSFDNPDSLDAASEVTGLEVKTSDWLDTDTDSGEVLSNQALMSSVFSEEVLEERINSELIEIAPRHVVVLRVIDYNDIRPKTLDDVRDEVLDTVKGQKATGVLTTLQESSVSALASGGTAADIATSSEFATAVEQLPLERSSTEFDQNVVTEIFGLAKPSGEAVTHAATMANGDLLAIRLDSVDAPDTVGESSTDEPSAFMPGTVTAGADPRRGSVEFEILLESLRGNADVDILSTAASPYP